MQIIQDKIFKSRNHQTKVFYTFGFVLLFTALQWLSWPVVKPAIYTFAYLGILLAALFGEGILAIVLLALSSLFLKLIKIPDQIDWLPELSRFGVFLLTSCGIVYTVRLLFRYGDIANYEKEQFSSVISNALDAFVGMDDNGRITHWNPKAEEIFGFEAKDVLGMKMSETIIPHEFREAHEMGMKHYLASGHGPVLNQRIEITALRKDERIIPIELSITPIKMRGKHFFGAFLRDVSVEKRLSLSLQDKLFELEQTKLKLTSAVQTKDEFLSLVAHELKTPLTSLKLQVQLSARTLLRSFGDELEFNTKVSELVRKEMAQVENLTRLVDDMLDMARVEGKKLSITPEEFDLRELVSDVIERHHPQFEKGNVPVLYVECAQPIHGTWDKFRIEQVITNLLTNALRYGNKLPVEVLVRETAEDAILEVIDHGIGIAPEYHSKIFNRFERIGDSVNAKGLGLGLYILKEIVNLHHGKITVLSELGKGSRFTVSLPKK